MTAKTPTIGRLILLALLVVIIIAAVLLKASDGKSATKPKSVVTARIVQGPGNFEWGQVLFYRIRLTNTSIALKKVQIGLFVSKKLDARSGGLYHRVINLKPRAARFIDFRVMSTNIPMSGSHELRCLTVYVGPRLSDHTCAPAVS